MTLGSGGDEFAKAGNSRLQGMALGTPEVARESEEQTVAVQLEPQVGRAMWNHCMRSISSFAGLMLPPNYAIGMIEDYKYMRGQVHDLARSYYFFSFPGDRTSI